MRPSILTLFFPCVLSLYLTRQEQKVVRWMPLGDSITDYGCWRAWIYLRLQNDPDLYDSVDLVGGEHAGEICDDSEFDRDHEGHPGFPAIQMANEGQLSEWLGKNPADVVTMHLGTVDIVRGRPRTEELLRAYTALVGQMRGRNPNIRIIVAQIIPLGLDAEKNEQVKELNRAIPTWAASQNTTASPIWAVDLFTGFDAEVDLYDGIHASPSGIQKIAEGFYPTLLTAIRDVQGVGSG
ncbi:SGNH hydrolase-type esterase domain-containing protein [Triangularia setosa]|uniref:SGNH hydrolase-type esterase domain-containing protein n=1 Tax=Triangularia setosa TaxID=2587417 RepID=A0AAN6VZQ4_9PEZI|nr:SGNH hydrolase-type esterase domain-containing protein [Podospora setosa]